MGDLENYRAKPSELARTSDLMRLLPSRADRALDLGAREGFFSKRLAERCEEVVAVDLQRPEFSHPGVLCVAGDARRLDFPDGYFEVSLCAEVLEHIGDGLEDACAELARVTRGVLVIGVPYRQDTRVGRTLCLECGETNPPWGHVNEFDEHRLRELFPLPVIEQSFVWQTTQVTNAMSASLMNLAGHPWGTYGQDEPCVYCGAGLRRPEHYSLMQRLCAAVAIRADSFQQAITRPRPNWIHMAFDAGSQRQ